MTFWDAIAEARSHVGYVEGEGKKNMFGEWYGANGSPWCAAFVSYVLNKSGHGHTIAGAQTAKGFNSCGKGIAHFKKLKAWHPVAEAKVGDLAFFDWNHDGEQDHVGIISKVDLGSRMVKVIEGNTSDKSHSNGGVVKEQWRNFSVIMGVGRPDWDKPAPKPAAKKPAAKKVTK